MVSLFEHPQVAVCRPTDASVYFLTCMPFSTNKSENSSLLSNRVESTDSLRGRIRELETECKKLSMDMKLKEEQIRDLEGKCQVRRNDSFFLLLFKSVSVCILGG